MLCGLLIIVAAITVAAITPTAALANATVTDWRGTAVSFTEGSVDSDGVEIVFHTAGEGPLVVFVHSISGPWFDWRHQLVALSEHYRVAVMSTRGTDKSGKPKGVEHYTMAKISGDIDAIIRHFGEEKAIVVGQDSGGFYAWHFAMTYPERTERLVSIGTIHPAGLIRELASNPEQQQASMFQRGMQENPDAPAAYGERIRSAPARPGDTPELAELRAAAYDRLDVESVANFYKANWPRPPFSLETEGFGFRIGEFPPVQAPTLLVYGRDSRPFTSRTLNDTWRWVDAPLTLLVLPGIGHGPHTQAPEIVTPAILEWLAAE
jgi:pimeloyl-ACP methyl ester carboxylesterase